MPCQRYIERKILLLIIKDIVVYMEICARHRHILRLWKSIWRFHQSKWENQFALEFMSDSGFTQTTGLFLHLYCSWLSVVVEVRWRLIMLRRDLQRPLHFYDTPCSTHHTQIMMLVAAVLNKHPFPHLETRQDAQHSSNSLTLNTTQRHPIGPIQPSRDSCLYIIYFYDILNSSIPSRTLCLIIN